VLLILHSTILDGQRRTTCFCLSGECIICAGLMVFIGCHQTVVGVLYAGDPRPGELGGGDNSCTERVVSLLTLLCVVAVSFVFSQNW